MYIESFLPIFCFGKRHYYFSYKNPLFSLSFYLKNHYSCGKGYLLQSVLLYEDLIRHGIPPYWSLFVLQPSNFDQMKYPRMTYGGFTQRRKIGRTTGCSNLIRRKEQKTEIYLLNSVKVQVRGTSNGRHSLTLQGRMSPGPKVRS